MPPFFTQVFGLAYVILGCVVVFVGIVIDGCNGCVTLGPSGAGLKLLFADNADVQLMNNVIAVMLVSSFLLFTNMIIFFSLRP